MIAYISELLITSNCFTSVRSMRRDLFADCVGNLVANQTKEHVAESVLLVTRSLPIENQQTNRAGPVARIPLQPKPKALTADLLRDTSFIIP